MPLSLKKYIHKIQTINPILLEGRVTKVVGTVIEGNGPSMPLGGICQIYPPRYAGPVLAEVIGFREGALLLMPLCSSDGIEPGSRIVAKRYKAAVNVGFDMLGRVLDGLGEPIDGGPPIRYSKAMPLYAKPLNPLTRSRIKEPLDVGVRAINSLVTLAKGQRAAIMAGSGVGKSVLLGMMARFTRADVNVIALIGERGREVKEFIERDLGEEGLKRSVVVVATSDTSPLIRMRGAYLATAIAEFFRDNGKDVLLMMDSITRFAMAAREVGLASGEPPSNKAYPPSTFAHLPKLLERAGTNGRRGSITGLYTVLVEGDDMNEPIADAVRSIVDGHIVLDRTLASRGHYPAIDVLKSVSRLMTEVVDQSLVEYCNRFRAVLADYAKIEDLVNLGAYKKGNNKKADYAVEMIDRLNAFLRQDVTARSTMEEGFKALKELFASSHEAAA
ncbi:MAG: FliI/YscN family ATPase [Deltaproteobacteria bacterium]|nr:FliI/YscN family ATPase [Deltaproteobacteria bacterium]MBW1928476.1 FliI/YscN family ATPase [Deltaproteobacteria bacterium]MBW2024189.1 FliI/YscN family ATPase [Deltaproteobacteria bacterium]MBW2124892.1 FliI/YscN family ATPase [Deltaproteobacteria bacterium]